MEQQADNFDLRMTIEDLISNNYRFCIPSYQRGYRWTESEVVALLDDISEFEKEANSDQQYCLQPLILKRRDDGSYEVVDGQQRLTTIYIFLKIAEKKSECAPFEIQFDTRSHSKEFLENLPASQSRANENIDFFHISNAYTVIENWIGRQRGLRVNVINKLFETITERVFFIWYVLPDHVNPVDIYTKVNMGKIPLTNAELIRALLFNKDHFSEDSERRQLEMAMEWDRIEQGLQNNSLWYFLSEPNSMNTRIDLIFNLLADKYRAKDEVIDSTLRYNTFLVFDSAIKAVKGKAGKAKEEKRAVEKFIDELWLDVKRTYDEFCEWYSDLDKYHVIGFLVASKVSLREIFSIMHDKTKQKAKDLLLQKTKQIVMGSKTMSVQEYVDRISYGDTRTAEIRSVLLLFNLATAYHRANKEYRFPFDLYKKPDDQWDVEHIHATNDESAEPDNGIGNLSLLSASINRSYKDEPFNIKRQVIMQRESEGKFVPLCTKNVFLKAYTKNPLNFVAWEDSDKEAYKNTIIDTLAGFWGVKADGTN